MALDSRGLASGFLQGFQVMDQHQARKQQQEVQKEQMEMQRETQGMRRESHEAALEDRERAKYKDIAIASVQQVANGLPVNVADPELQKAWEYHPQLSFKHLFSPKTMAAAEFGEKMASGEIDVDMFSPEAAPYMNDFFAPEVNKGPGGKKRISRMYPGQTQGTVTFDLDVEDDNGEHRLNPMTEGRGIAGEDDNIKEVPIESLIQKVAGANALYKTIPPERIDQIRGYLFDAGIVKKDDPEWGEMFDGPGGSVLQRDSNGRVEPVLGRESKLSGLGGSRGWAPSTDVKTMQYIQQQNPDWSDQQVRDELVRIKSGSTTNELSPGQMRRVQILENRAERIQKRIESGTLSAEEEVKAEQELISTAEELRAMEDNLLAGDDAQPGIDPGLQGRSMMKTPEQRAIDAGKRALRSAEPRPKTESAVKMSDSVDQDYRNLWQ